MYVIKSLHDAELALNELKREQLEISTHCVNAKGRQLRNVGPSLEKTDAVIRLELTVLRDELMAEINQLNRKLEDILIRVKALE